MYNYHRPHLSCDMLVPEQAHQHTGKLKRRWKNYYHRKVAKSIVGNEIQDLPKVVNIKQDQQQIGQCFSGRVKQAGIF